MDTVVLFVSALLNASITALLCFMILRVNRSKNDNVTTIEKPKVKTVKELLSDRERLALYDTLVDFKDFIDSWFYGEYCITRRRSALSKCEDKRIISYEIRKAIVDALEAEIKKLDEE